MELLKKHPVVVGITGGSGAVMARSLIDELLGRDVPVVASASSAARIVWDEEVEESFGSALERWKDFEGFRYFAPGDLRAPIASGSTPTLGMAIVPCSMATVAAVAHGLSDNLIRRAADVCLKERRPLVIVPRETPLNAIHLENMASLARLGVTILPPEPAFYLKPKTTEDTVDYIVQRVLAALGLLNELPESMRWRPK
ncbi:MAG: UbiX family flavin prenyltransferase [Chloroflexi bacterium]|nr:UbiX family flavin prenyltransferase [Chloroflexota bacterium]